MMAIVLAFVCDSAMVFCLAMKESLMFKESEMRSWD